MSTDVEFLSVETGRWVWFDTYDDHDGAWDAIHRLSDAGLAVFSHPTGRRRWT